MSSNIKNVVLVGANGNLGPYILSALTGNSHFNVSVLVRKSSSKTDYPAGVKVLKVDDGYPVDELVKVFQGQDAVISVIATEHLATQTNLINAAAKAGVKRFVPSEFGSDTTVAELIPVLPQFFQPKVSAVDLLKEKSKETGLTWTAIVTGPFFEFGIGTGFLGFDLKTRKATITNSGNDVWSVTRQSTIGLAVANSLLVPDQTANRYVFVDSFAVSQNQLLGLVEKHTGGSKWTVEHVDADQQKDLGLDLLSKGDHSAVVLILRWLIQVEKNGGNYLAKHKSDNELLKLPKDDIDTAVAEAIKGFSQ